MCKQANELSKHKNALMFEHSDPVFGWLDESHDQTYDETSESSWSNSVLPVLETGVSCVSQDFENDRQGAFKKRM